MGMKRNLKRMTLYKFLSDFWLIAPILIPFYQSNGLNATQVFTVQAVYSAAILILEIPSGYFADVFGRKAALILGAAFIPVGLTVYAFSNNFFLFCLAEILLAIGGSMRSGSDSALVYDSLKQLNREDEFKLYSGKAEFFMRLGTASSAVISGFLAMAFLRLPFYLNILSGVAITVVSFFFTEPRREKPEHKNALTGIIRSVSYTLDHPKLRSLLFLNVLVFSTGITGIWSYYLLYQKLGIHIAFFGVLFAVFAFLSGYGAKKAHLLEKTIGKDHSLFLLLLPAAFYILLGLFPNRLLIPLIFLNGFILGYSGPVIQDHVNRYSPSSIRATILSTGSMAASLGFVLLSPLFGFITDKLSLPAAYIFLGCLTLVLAVPVYFSLLRNRIITGDRP